MIEETTEQQADPAVSGSRQERLVMCDLLAEKHHGMKISAPGILRRVGGHLKPGAQEMLKHLNEMAARFYAGDVKAVDEFLQLYCLDDDRPST
jgi:hypothetical protein